MSFSIPPFHVVLHQPQIPPNTGSIARTCAATGAKLHLVGPMGFSVDDKQVRRAGLDYWPYVNKSVYGDWDEWLTAAPGNEITRVYAFSTKSKRSFWEAKFQPGDAFLFGREDRGLPRDLPFSSTMTVEWLQVPMKFEHVRSLNLSVSVGVVLFEAIRQHQS